jgi:hypothetical protein
MKAGPNETSFLPHLLHFRRLAMAPISRGKFRLIASSLIALASSFAVCPQVRQLAPSA